MYKKYDIIYSLGADCACAMYMNKFHLRRASGPFDWLTHAPFKTRIDLILNDFADFLNMDDMRFLAKEPNMFNDEKCDYYENTNHGLRFYHDFPVGQPFGQTFPSVYEKYSRRIARFYDNIEKHNRVLLIWYAQAYNTPDNVILDLCNKVCKKFNKQIDFIIIEHDESMPRNKIKTRQIADNIVRHAVYALDDATPTLGNYRLIDKIFSKIRIRGKIQAIVRTRVVKFVMRFLSLFIPSRKMRHDFRKTISKWARI